MARNSKAISISFNRLCNPAGTSKWANGPVLYASISSSFCPLCSAPISSSFCPLCRATISLSLCPLCGAAVSGPFSFIPIRHHIAQRSHVQNKEGIFHQNAFCFAFLFFPSFSFFYRRSRLTTTPSAICMASNRSNEQQLWFKTSLRENKQMNRVFRL